MKANELMTGDLVQVKDCIDQSYYFDEYEPGEIVQVREILDNGINPNWAGAEVSSILGLEDIQPIPITPEILEKNFGVVERSSDGYSCVINRELLLAFHLEATLDIWIAQPSDWPHLTYSLPLPRYVHELQHALRLCGIKKEISLC